MRFHATYAFMIILWLLGAGYGVFLVSNELTELFKTQAKGLGEDLGSLFFWMNIFGAAHLFLVFHSIHSIDHHPRDWRAEFPHWIGSRLEIVLRLAMILGLLTVGGEIPGMVHMYTRDPDIFTPQLFVYSTCALFGVLVLWDIGAMFRHAGLNWRSMWSVLTSRTSRFNVVRSDGLAFLVWGIASYWVYHGKVESFTFKVCAVAGVVYCLVVLARILTFASNGFAFGFVTHAGASASAKQPTAGAQEQ